MSKFQDILIPNADDIETLPLLHTCDAFSLRNILETTKLVPHMCDVFNLNLLYAYYGIPSYRPKYDLATNNPAYFMICIILDSSKFNTFYKVFPFDSGAFEKMPDLKKLFFHHKSKINDYELEANIVSAKRVIKTFYQSNENYVLERPISDEEFSLFDFEAHSYKNLINDKTNNAFDNRASSIEVLFDEEIILDPNTVKQIIIPKSFKDDKKIFNLIKNKLGINNPLCYTTFRGIPQESFGQIRNQYLKFIQLKS